MASPEEIAPWLPETLPEDFSEWDSEGSPTAMPVNSREEWEAWQTLIPSPRLQRGLGNPLTAMQPWHLWRTGRVFRVQLRPHQSLLSSNKISAMGIAKHLLRLSLSTLVTNGERG